MKNEKSGAESFAENMRKKLGIYKPLPKEVMDDLREGVIDIGKKTGDTNAEDVLDNCLIELGKLKDNQSKAIVITYQNNLLSTSAFFMLFMFLNIARPPILFSKINLVQVSFLSSPADNNTSHVSGGVRVLSATFLNNLVS
jgi:hypothetical protein